MSKATQRVEQTYGPTPSTRSCREFCGRAGLSLAALACTFLYCVALAVVTLLVSGSDNFSTNTQRQETNVPDQDKAALQGDPVLLDVTQTPPPPSNFSDTWQLDPDPPELDYPPPEQLLQASGGQCRSPAVHQGIAVGWVPSPDVATRKYLLLDCVLGQISNRKWCIMHNMVLAALLNRTLVVPTLLPFAVEFEEMCVKYGKCPSGLPYDLRVVWDLNNLRTCLGPNVVITVQEYLEEHKAYLQSQASASAGSGTNGTGPLPDTGNLEKESAISIDRIHCAHGPEGYCSKDPDLYGPAIGCPLGLVRPTEDGAQPSLFINSTLLQTHFEGVHVDATGASFTSSCLGRRLTLKKLLSLMGDPTSGGATYQSRMLLPGDILPYAILDPTWGLIAQDNLNPHIWCPLGAIDFFKRRPECPHFGLILPPKVIMNHAKRLLLSWFGMEPYMALHWRRADFKEYCTAGWNKNGQCWKTPEEAGACVGKVMARNNITRLFVATNGDASEVADLTQAARDFVGEGLMVKQNNASSDLTWLQPSDLPGVNLVKQRHTVFVTLEKALAAHAAFFIGSYVSSFTMDVYRIRVGLGRDTTCDLTLAQCGRFAP